MNTQYGVGEYRTGEAAYLCRSKAIPPASRRAALSCHGGGGTAASTLPSAGVTALAEAGYPVHVGDYSASTYLANGNWGNSDAVTALTAGVTWLTGVDKTKTDKVFITAGSMGALTALNYYKANPTKVAAIHCTIPALDLDDIQQNNKGGFGPSLVAAYGHAWPTLLNSTELAASSPAVWAVGANALTVPVLLHTSDDDPVASNTAAAQSFAATVNANGGNVTVTSIGAQGHAAALTVPQVADVVNFFNANGGLA